MSGDLNLIKETDQEILKGPTDMMGQVRSSIEEAAKQSQQIFNPEITKQELKAIEEIQATFEHLFESMHGGLHSWADDFAKTLEKIAAQAAAADLANALFGTPGKDKDGNPTRSADGILSGVMSSIFGSPAGSNPTPAVQGVGGTPAASSFGGIGDVAGVLGKAIGGIFGFAGGGDASGLVRVGETGPETVALPQGSRVFNDRQLGGGGQTIHYNPVNNVAITARDGDSTLKQAMAYMDYTRQQDKSELYRTLQRNGLGRLR